MSASLHGLYIWCADGRVKASPYARKLASESGVDLSGLKGSGPGGRIVAEDVQGAGGKPKVRTWLRGISRGASCHCLQRHLHV
jgi:pyruvate/2-oxoglutarate dehydrogenase complex dihydrolipoamide acyltransferase (E2) component